MMKAHADSAVTRETWPSLTILNNGECEPLKAVVHGAALGLCALMGAYNAAAWLKRRQSHLAINAAIYLGAVVWEYRHVVHHLRPCLQASAARASGSNVPAGAPDREAAPLRAA